MDKKKQIRRMLNKYKKYIIKQSIAMNNIIDEQLKLYYNGDLTTVKISDEDIFINEIYNKAVKLFNEGLMCFAYESETPDCILLLGANIERLEVNFGLNSEEIKKMKR